MRLPIIKLYKFLKGRYEDANESVEDDIASIFPYIL